MKRIVVVVVLLLFGISKRETLHDPGRSDTIMLALVDPEPREIHLISIPSVTLLNYIIFSKS